MGNITSRRAFFGTLGAALVMPFASALAADKPKNEPELEDMLAARAGDYDCLFLGEHHGLRGDEDFVRRQLKRWKTQGFTDLALEVQEDSGDGATKPLRDYILSGTDYKDIGLFPDNSKKDLVDEAKKQGYRIVLVDKSGEYWHDHPKANREAENFELFKGIYRRSPKAKAIIFYGATHGDLNPTTFFKFLGYKTPSLGRRIKDWMGEQALIVNLTGLESKADVQVNVNL